MSKQALLLSFGLLAPGINQTPRSTVLVDAKRTVSRAGFAAGRAKVVSVTVNRNGHVFAHVVA